MIWLVVLASIGGYVLGSIPFGVVVSRWLGVPDPRLAGSRNVGFTNVLRVGGKTAGILTLIGDIGKGWLVGWVGSLLFQQESIVLLVAMMSILGHLFSIFLHFKGGKGVATALGAVLGVAPWIGLTLMGIWVGAVLLWRYSSGGALVAFGLFPIVALLFHQSWLFVLFAFLVALLIWSKHTDNLVRLWMGTERRIGDRPSEQGVPR